MLSKSLLIGPVSVPVRSNGRRLIRTMAIQQSVTMAMPTNIGTQTAGRHDPQQIVHLHLIVALS